MVELKKCDEMKTRAICGSPHLHCHEKELFRLSVLPGSSFGELLCDPLTAYRSHSCLKWFGEPWPEHAWRKKFLSQRRGAATELAAFDFVCRHLQFGHELAKSGEQRNEFSRVRFFRNLSAEFSDLVEIRFRHGRKVRQRPKLYNRGESGGYPWFSVVVNCLTKLT